MKRTFEWWTKTLKRICRFTDIADGTYKMIRASFPQAVRNETRITLNCEAETAVFPVSCSDYREACKRSGIPLEKGLYDPGDGNLIPDVKTYPVWIFQAGSLISVGSMVKAVCLNEPSKAMA